MPPTPASRGTPVPRTPGSGPAPSTPVPPTPAAVIALTQRPSEATDAPGTTAVDSCHNCSFQDSKNKGPRSDVKGAKSLVEGNSETKDYWEFDEARHAWVLVHLRPRKRLFAPVRKDYPFDSNKVEPERITEWRCKGKVSVHRDNWQETPYLVRRGSFRKDVCRQIKRNCVQPQPTLQTVISGLCKGSSSKPVT